MSEFVGGQNALSYVGVEAPEPPNVIKAQRAPSTGDLGHRIGTIWLDRLLNNVWMLTSIAGNLANWEPMSQSAGGSAPTTKFVVDADATGDFLTIQAAIDAIQLSGTTNAEVFVRPGTYTESLVLYDNLIITGTGAYSIITGVHTPPAAGAVFFRDLNLTSATDIVTSAAAGTARLSFTNCNFNCTNGYVVDCASWTGPVDLYDCSTTSTADGGVNVAASTVVVSDSLIGAGANVFTMVAGTLVVIGSQIACPLALSGANAGSITQGSTIGGTITLAGTAALAIRESTLTTGATAAIAQGSAGAVNLSDVTITSSANPCITGAGAGVVTFSGVHFMSNALLAGTLTRAYVAESKFSKVTAGDSTYRVDLFAADNGVVQVFADDPTVSGAANLASIIGDLTVSAGDGSHVPRAIEGSISLSAGSDSLQTLGVLGTATQVDGSVIGSTLAGVEGSILINETDAADIPQIYAFGVKGYYITDDAAGVPVTGVYGGVGSVVEYTTPLDGYGYGVVATRLGGGAGTAGRAAFGVAQGTQAIADWLYGLDLLNTSPSDAGVAYTTADIRLWDESTIVSDATSVTVNCVAGDDFYIDLGDDIGVNTFEVRNNSDAPVSTIDSLGDITGRNINVSNTNIESFNVNPILQSVATTGAAPTGATGDVNAMYLQDGITMEEFVIGAGQTIIAPRLANDGLLISLDLIATEGVEYNFGATTRSRHTYTIGTSAAFFVEAQFLVADVSGCEPFLLGFRKVEANNAVYTGYADYATIGIVTSANADLISLSTEIGGGGNTETNTTDAWTDGQTHTVRVNVSAGGVVTYLIDGVAPGATAAYTFTGALQVMPFIYLTHAAAAPGAIHMISLACGLQ